MFYNVGCNWYIWVDVYMVFLQDSFLLVNDCFNIQLGLKCQEVKCDFFNFVSGLIVNSGGVDYEVKQIFSNMLGNVGLCYQFIEIQLVFLNLGQNVCVLENIVNIGLVQIVVVSNYIIFIVNGVLIVCDSQGNIVLLCIGLFKVSLEKFNNIDFGYCYVGNCLIFFGLVFYIDFKDCIVSQYDLVLVLSIQFNVGVLCIYGLELEVGYKMNDNWNMYGLLIYVDFSMFDDKVVVWVVIGIVIILQILGKQMFDIL